MLQPNDYALVIGVDDYPNYRSLNGPVHDATEFAAWLTDAETGGGLPLDNCHLLPNADYPIGIITETLDKIVRQIGEARKEGQTPRRFYLYFSGHGQANKIDEVNLCLSKWSSTIRSRLALSARDCWTEMVNCTGFAEVAIFLDCCRVWVAGAGGMPPGINCAIPAQAAAETHVFQAFSSEFLRKSFEGQEEPIGMDADPVYSGYFTRVLLTALKGAAATPPAGVNQKALKQYLEAEVPRLANQKPVILPHLPDEAIFGSAKPIIESNLTIQFTSGRLGPVVLVLPNNEELPCPDWTQNWDLQLDKGLYCLIDKDKTPEDDRYFRIPETSHVDF